jgi:hypothetical protein
MSPGRPRLEYSFRGRAAFSVGLSDYDDRGYAASALVDVLSGHIDFFCFTIAGKGSWAGRGGIARFVTDQDSAGLILGVGTQDGAVYSEAANGFIPASKTSYLAFILGHPDDFGGFVEGFPTEVALSGCTNRQAIFLRGAGCSFGADLVYARGSGQRAGDPEREAVAFRRGVAG